MQAGETPVELANCGSLAIFRALVLMHLTTKKTYLIDTVSKCCCDAAQSWEVPKVTIRRYVVSNKK